MVSSMFFVLRTGIPWRDDADSFRSRLCQHSTSVCIPPRRNRKRRALFHRGNYRRRHHVEKFFLRIKRHRRISTRYDKLAQT